MADRKTVLVAEDDLALLKAITVRLEKAGLRVIPVQDGYQALQRCLSEQPDVLLMDVNMPAGTGLSVQDRMHQHPEVASIPVIYMTGDTRQSLLVQAEALGAIAILQKPVDTRELVAVVMSAIDSCQQTDA